MSHTDAASLIERAKSKGYTRLIEHRDGKWKWHKGGKRMWWAVQGLINDSDIEVVVERALASGATFLELED